MKKKILLFLLSFALLTGIIPAAVAQLKMPELPSDITTLTLDQWRKLEDRDVQTLGEKLNEFPLLTEVDLTAVTISPKAAYNLIAACPQISFHFVFDLYGKKVDSLIADFDVDSLERSKKITFKELRYVLSCMPNLETVTMYNSLFPLADMEALVAELHEVDFRWTAYTNKMKVKVGATAYSTLKGRQDPRYKAKDMDVVIRYCPELLALDVGHNDVSDLEFLKAWPGLRRLIVIDSKTPVTDISPLAELKDLEYVELFMQNITDISALAGHEKLLDLNLCHNDITDLSPLYSCVNLERLWISYNKHLTQEEIDKLQAALPGCVIETEVWSSTDAGWREHPRYDIMYQSFTEQRYIPFDE